MYLLWILLIWHYRGDSKMAKYNSYIELRPGYESVVDIGSEERNPNLWQ